MVRLCNIIIGYAMVEIVDEGSSTTQRNNKTYRKQKHSEVKESDTSNEVYTSSIRTLQWLLLSLKEVVHEMSTMA